MAAAPVKKGAAVSNRVRAFAVVLCISTVMGSDDCVLPAYNVLPFFSDAATRRRNEG